MSHIMPKPRWHLSHTGACPIRARPFLSHLFNLVFDSKIILLLSFEFYSTWFKLSLSFFFFNLVFDSLLTLQFSPRCQPIWSSISPRRGEKKEKKKESDISSTSSAHCDHLHDPGFEFYAYPICRHRNIEKKNIILEFY